MNVGNNQWQSSAAAMCELDNLQLRANQVVGKYKQIQKHMRKIKMKYKADHTSYLEHQKVRKFVTK